MFVAIIISILAALFYSLTNHIDKFLVNDNNSESNIKTVLIFSTFISGLFAPIWFIISGFDISISIISLISIFTSSILSISALYLYFKSLEVSDTSTVVVMFQLIPVFNYILGLILFKENLDFRQIIGSIFIILSTILISINLENKKTSFKVLLLMTLCSFFYSLYYILFDIGIRNSPYNSCIFYLQIGYLLIGLIFLFIKSFRSTFFKTIKCNGKKFLSLNIINELLNIIGTCLENYANVLIPIALVTVISRVQVIFVFIIGLIGTIFLPKYFKEDISKKTILKKVFCIMLSIVGFIIAFI